VDNVLLLLAPMLAAVATGVVALLADAFGTRTSAVALTGLGLLAATVVAVVGAVRVPEPTSLYGVFAGGAGFANTTAFILGMAALVMVGGWRSFAQRPGGGVAAALIAFSAAAAVAVSQSLDLVMTLIALETMAAAAYGLVSGARNARSDEAAMKYLVQGAVSTGLIVLATAILVGLFGRGSSYQALAEAITSTPALPATAAASLILASFAFKLSAVPFHSWAPDVFETAPPSASAFLATAPKFGALIAAFIIFGAVFDGNVQRLGIQVAVVAALSIVVGNFAGLRQVSYTRLLGYSGIAQIGYALVALAVGAGYESGAILQLMPLVLVMVGAYSIAAAGAFLCADAVRATRPDWDGSIAGLAGLARERRALSVALAVFMFSLTGIPLTAGFWGKLLVFGAAIQSDVGWLAWVGIIGSVVSFGYYGGVLRAVFFEGSSQPSAHIPAEKPSLRAPGLDTVVIWLLAAAVLVGGVAPVFGGVELLVNLFSG